MKTVGEFENAGVVFVNDDKGEGFLVKKASVFNLHKTWSNCKVTSFAWRDLTTKPDNAKFKIELDTANHRWRPSLNQGEEWPDEQRIGFDNTAQQFEALASGKKPSIKMLSVLEEVKEIESGFITRCQLIAPSSKQVFTQAMADAGELPPVGSEFRTDGDEDCDDGYCYLRCVAHHIDGGVIGQDDSARMFLVMTGALALENLTQKQKFVDDMYFDLTGDIASHDEMMDNDAYANCEVLYDAGYRKYADA